MSSNRNIFRMQFDILRRTDTRKRKRKDCMEQKLIKSRMRVRKHGEVFTPAWMVEKMLNVEGIKESCNTIDATFLEPAAGEGNFLMAILERKLNLVKEQYSPTLAHYEN